MVQLYLCTHLTYFSAVVVRAHVVQEEAKGNMDSELAIVLSSIAVACKQIASLVTRAGISNLTGLAGAANIQASAYTLARAGAGYAGLVIKGEPCSCLQGAQQEK